MLQTLVIPGNHDIPLYNLIARIFTPYRAYSRAFGNELEGIIDSRDFLLITVNTTRRWRHVQGAVSAAQIERVVQRLRAASDQQLRVVVTHQPLHVTRAEDEKNLLRNGAAAARAWAQAGADLVLGGHIHLPYVRALSERFSDLPRELWCAQAGTSVSKRVRYGAPNSVNVIRSIAAKEFVVEQWDYAASRGRFLKAHSTVIALSR